MDNSLLITIAVLSLIILSLVFVLFMRVHSVRKQQQILTSQLSVVELQVNDLQIQQSQLSSLLDSFHNSIDLNATENSQVSRQLEHRIKKIQQEFIELSQHFDRIKQEQPQDKFYLRANKLAAKGAGVEEIMAECELPRAEVEMLLAIHKKVD